jgi:hypothetical protein
VQYIAKSLHRIYVRHAGAFLDEPIPLPESIDTSKPIDVTSQAAIDAVKNISSPDATIRIIWT